MKKNIHGYIHLGLLLSNMLILIHVRVIDVSYDFTDLIGTDSVRYVYQSQQIVEQGLMPDVDKLRSAPLGKKTSEQLTFYPYVIAAIYHVVKIAAIDFEQLVIILPVLLFVLTIIPVYLMVRRIFDHYVALLSINIMVLMPYLLARTHAGFADRDGLVLLLSMWSFFFYVQSQFETDYKQWIYRGLSAISMSCLGLTWQGFGIFASIVITVELVRLMVDARYDGKSAGQFALWTLPILGGLLLFKPEVYSHFNRPYAFIGIVYPACVLLAAFLVTITQRVSRLRRLLSIGYQFPVGFGIVCLLVIISLPLITSYLFKTVLPSLITPFGNRPVFDMIAEVQKVGGIGWLVWPGIFLIPMTIGLLLITNSICSSLQLHKYWTLLLIQIMIFGVAFSRFASGQSNTNFIENSLTLGIYLISMVMGIVGLLLGFAHARLKHKVDAKFFVENTIYIEIFLVVWVLGMLIAFRAGIRFAQFFVIPCTILGSYALLWPFKEWIRQHKHYWLYALFALCIMWQVYALVVDKIQVTFIFRSIYVLLVCITLLFGFLMTKQLTKSTMKHRIGIVSLMVYIVALTALSPHVVLGGYAFRARAGLTDTAPLLVKDEGVRKALTWLRENTSPDAVVAAGWEYGSWLNLLSKRATIVDEQQRLGWVSLMAEKVFLAKAGVPGALEYLSTHEADYLLLTKRNIEFIEAIAREARIRDSISLPIFGNIVQKVHFVDEVEERTAIYYRYWLPEWEPVMGEYDLTLDTETHPAGTWYIATIYLLIEESKKTVLPVKAMLELNLDGTVKYVPPQYIHYENTVLRSDEQSHPFPCTIIIDSNGGDDPTKWHIVYLSSEIRSLLMIRLFLLGELGEFFERVYPTTDNAEDFTAQIWKIHYPNDIEMNPEYLR